MGDAMDKKQLDAYQRFSSLLSGIETFVEKHPQLTYIEFDYYVVHDMTLFSIEPEFDFEQLEQSIQVVKKSMPASKRIFNKPIIVLKDTDDVLPVENTRIINQNTLLHLANHSQHVSNLTKTGVRPRKLLTRIYEDDYAIYENIVFCNYIDEVLYFVNKNRRILNSVIYASDIMEFNLLEKANHLKYFLALGKLHTGYIRDFSQYFNLSKAMLNELLGLTKVIQPRLSKPVYKKNNHRNPNLPLKKTNIFLMQKDYKMVYKTYKYLLNTPNSTPKELQTVDFDRFRKNYILYVQLLSIFAAGHFNFVLDSKTKMKLNALDVNFTFKDWKLNIQNLNNEAVLLYFKKDQAYRMMIVGSDTDEETIRVQKLRRRLHEVVVVNPLDDDYNKREDVYVSMSDIDSFRRLQQMLLRGMIHSDTERTVCPFCGGHLEKNKRHEYHQCSDCLTQIKTGVCPDTKQAYFYTDTPHRRKQMNVGSLSAENDQWYYERQVESLMYFRNITKIDPNGKIICPHCHKVHKETML